MESNRLSFFDSSKFCDIELIMRYEEFVSLLFHIHKMKSQLQTLIFPKYASHSYSSKDKTSVTLEIFNRIVRDLHEVWQCNLPCDNSRLAELHKEASGSLADVLTLDECTKFFSAFVIAQYETLKAEMVKRKLLLCSVIVCKFVTRPESILKEMLQVCDDYLKDLPEFMKKFEPYFIEEEKADKFTFRDAVRTLCNHLSCRNEDRPDTIFDEAFSIADEDKDGKLSREELTAYIKKVIEAVKDKILEVIAKE
eukprot:TRINITY_DN3834_c0_g4_i1.p1 TRINITY_DN3834_c0_g4~~TRINITY_DN3834_c0_g4_i1.p1  ORF type:complete len:291 (-),score=91.12 TRINITY_DN3834_c0_g4_i1:103-858(-)